MASLIEDNRDRGRSVENPEEATKEEMDVEKKRAKNRRKKAAQ